MICLHSVNALLASRRSCPRSIRCSKYPSVHCQAHFKRRGKSCPTKFVSSCSTHVEGPGNTSSPDPGSDHSEDESALSITSSSNPSTDNSSTDPVLFNDTTAGDSAMGTPVHHDNLPPELQNLRITDDGELIDDLTGKAVNAFGASR